MERTGLKKRALTSKQALIAPSLLPLLLSIEFNSNIYIIHNQISPSSLPLAIILLLLFRKNYFIFLDGHIHKTYYGIFTPLISEKRTYFSLKPSVYVKPNHSLDDAFFVLEFYSSMAVVASRTRRSQYLVIVQGSFLDFFQVF